MADDDIYSGNHFSVGTSGGEWTIWRFRGEDWRFRGEDETERIVLAQGGMDELAAYFADCYAEDRARWGEVERVEA